MPRKNTDRPSGGNGRQVEQVSIAKAESNLELIEQAKAPPPPDPGELRCLYVSSGRDYAVVRIIRDGREDDYLFRRINLYITQLTALHAGSEITYTINYGKAQAKCGCQGYLSRRTCRHIDAVAALQRAGVV